MIKKKKVELDSQQNLQGGLVKAGRTLRRLSVRAKRTMSGIGYL
jgi:hypothetical protein